MPGPGQVAGVVTFSRYGQRDACSVDAMFVTSVLGLGPHIWDHGRNRRDHRLGFQVRLGWWSDRLRKRKDWP
jgi:hypothetical protein